MEGNPQATSPLRAERIAIVGFFVTTLTLFLPSTVYFTNSNEFSNTYGDLLVTCLCVGATLALSLWLGLFLLRRIGQAWLVRAVALLCGLGFLVWLQGNFLLWPYGPLDGRDIPWRAMAKYGYIDGSVWLAVVIATLVFSRRVVRVGARVSVVLTLAQLAYWGVLVARQPEVPSFKRYMVDERDKFVFSAEKNVIIVVLDSFPTDVFMEIVRHTPRLAKPFEGFTLFRNSLSAFPFTELSIASILTGRCYDNSMPYGRWKREAYTSQSLPSALKSAGWRVDLFPRLSYSLYYSEDVASNFVRGLPLRNRLQDVAFVYDIALFRAVPHFVRRFVYSNQEWLIRPLLAGAEARRPSSDATVRVLRSDGKAKGPTKLITFSPGAYASTDVKFVDAALTTSTVEKSRGAFKFFHWSVPHIPLILNQNFHYQRPEVNRPNYVNYATAGLKLVGLFLDHLRALGIYENSLIFVIGDHGAGFQPVPLVLQPGMRLDDGATAVVEPFKTAALPLVLVKPFGASGALKVSDAPVSLTDIPATVFGSLGMTIKTQGTPVFSVSETQPRERRFFKYWEGDIFSYYGDMTEYIVSGNGWQDTSWHPSGRVFTKSGVVMRHPPAIGQDLLFGVGEALDVTTGGFHHIEYSDKTPFHWTDGAASIHVPIDASHRPTKLSVGVLFSSKPGLRLQILLDNCEVASETMPGGQWSKDIDLGTCAPTGRWTTIRFLSETVQPGGRDRRELGVALTRVVLN